MSGYRGVLGEGENAQKVCALVVLEKEQREAGTACVTEPKVLRGKVSGPETLSRR